LARRQDPQLDRYVSVATDKAPELAMRPGFLSTFGMARDQGGKLGLGKNKAIICMYSTYQVHYTITYEDECAVWKQHLYTPVFYSGVSVKKKGDHHKARHPETD
jgi:hypothetical protein